MRIEELQNNLYIKSTDSVEKYLLNIIQEYFKDSNEALEGSREYIIKEAVDRLRTEMDYNSLGVLSITLPDGRILKGDVTITLDDLNGEPLIDPKLSAFNVNFGNLPNTACEGNDPRLYDARKPIKHEHEIEDIRGLEGKLSWIIGNINRNDIYLHNHSNKELLDKLTYTGESNTIDLNIIDTLEPKIDRITDQITNNIRQYISDTTDSINTLNSEMVEINHRIDLIKEYVIEKCEEYLNAAKQYIDDKCNEVITEVETYVEANYAKKDDVQALIDIANRCYTLVNTETYRISELLLSSISSGDLFKVSLQLSQDTLDEFMRRRINIGSSDEVIFEFLLEYEKGVKIYRQPLPYLDNINGKYEPFMYPLLPDMTVNGYIQAMQHNNNILDIEFRFNDNLSREFLNESRLICRIYAKDYCPVIY